VPKVGRVTVNEPVYYRSLHFLEVLGEPAGDLAELAAPIDPFEDTHLSDEAKLRPGVGVLTVHEQAWRQKGLELGNLLQSVCLAPGEVTQVAVTRWKHDTKGAGAEAAEQREGVTSQAEQHRAVNEVQRAVANEAQWGTSSASSSSSSAQAGASCWFANASAATTSTSAMTAQFSGGSRNLAAESTNAIDQRTAETSQALRSRRQSVVREVSEEEAESLSTRVLANYNRRHTLNILFFEVLQSYELKTVLKAWERCLFLPMVPLDFEQAGVIARHQAELSAIFRQLGATEMFEHLNRALGQEEAAGKALAGYELERSALRKAHQMARDYAELQEQLQRPRKLIAQDDDQIRKLQEIIKRIDQRESVGITRADAEEAIRRKTANRTRLAAAVEAKEQSLAERVAAWKLLLEERTALPPIGTPVETIQKAIHDLEAKIAAYMTPAGKIFNSDRVFLSQQLWLRMPPYRIHRILQKYRMLPDPAPDPDKQAAPEARSLAALVDPQPVGVFGSYLALRWSYSKDEVGEAARKRFKKKYLDPIEGADGQAAHAFTRRIGLPTSGIFAEAVLGEGLAAETIDRQFPSWGDKENRIPILPPKIADLQSRDRAKGMDLGTGDFAPSLAQLRAEQLASASYIDKMLGQVGRGDMFRDMGGLAQAVNLADKLGALSAEGATKAGERATQLQAKVLDTFEKVLDGPVGQAAVAEFMLPGSGAALLQGKKEQTAAAKPEAAKA
jgi:hypothetical protein